MPTAPRLNSVVFGADSRHKKSVQSGRQGGGSVSRDARGRGRARARFSGDIDAENGCVGRGAVGAGGRPVFWGDDAGGKGGAEVVAAAVLKRDIIVIIHVEGEEAL